MKKQNTQQQVKWIALQFVKPFAKPNKRAQQMLIGGESRSI